MESKVYRKQRHLGEFPVRRPFAGRRQGMAAIAIRYKTLEYDFQPKRGQSLKISSLVGVMSVYRQQTIDREGCDTVSCRCIGYLEEETNHVFAQRTGPEPGYGEASPPP